MNDAQHAAMKLAVVGSLAADSNKETRRGTYAKRSTTSAHAREMLDVIRRAEELQKRLNERGA